MMPSMVPFLVLSLVPCDREACNGGQHDGRQ